MQGEKPKRKKKRKLKCRGRRIVTLKRACLKCEKRFTARGRYIRLCEACKKHLAFQYADEECSVLLPTSSGKGKYDK